MAVTQYIGARYVPILDGEWDRSKAYEPLTIVQNEGNSYTSRQAVPRGVDIHDTTYWAVTGNYNAQIEAYRQEARRAVETADAASVTAQAADGKADTASTKAAENSAAIQAEEQARTAAIQAEEQARTAAIQAEEQARTAAIQAEEQARTAQGAAIEKELMTISQLAEFENVSMKLFGRILRRDAKYPQCICESGNNVIIGFTTVEDNHASVMVYSKASKQFIIDKAIACGHFNDICNTGSGAYPFISAPMNVEGTNQQANYLRCWNSDFTNHKDIQTPGLVPWAVTFDPVTEKTYFMAGGSIYELVGDEYSIIADMPDYRGYTGQGMAAYDGVMFMCTAESMAIQYDIETKQAKYVALSGVDAWNSRKLGEYEGCEFDNSGNLLCVNKVNPGSSTTDIVMAYCGYLKFGIPPMEPRYNQTSGVPIAPHISAATVGKFEIDRPGEVAFLHEVLTLIIKPTRVVVDTGAVVDESTASGRARLQLICPLYLNGTVKVDALVGEGVSGLIISDSGRLEAVCPSGDMFLYLGNSAAMFNLACTSNGRIVMPNSTRKDISTTNEVVFTTGNVSGLASNAFTFYNNVLAGFKIYKGTNVIG